jgi:predicted 2-oxoglutarate/Fe(II)-dependent dioxygenase YbiX
MYHICDRSVLDEQHQSLRLNDYYSFGDSFSAEECNKIIRSFDDLAVEQENKREQFTHEGPNEWIYQKVSDMVMEANRVMWKFNIVGITEPISYARYDTRDSEAARVDIGVNLNDSFRQDRKISFLIQLSEETSYEGGEVLLHNSGTPAYLSKERGTTLIFPSWLLNGTTPVTKETKRSLYGWVSGPPFS